MVLFLDEFLRTPYGRDVFALRLCGYRTHILQGFARL
jgi:hypothetical protein